MQAWPWKHADETSVAKKKIVSQSVIIFDFSVPLTLDSKKGTHFTGEGMQKMSAALQVDRKCPCAHHPQSRGAVERENSQFLNEGSKNLCEKLPEMSGCVPSPSDGDEKQCD